MLDTITTKSRAPARLFTLSRYLWAVRLPPQNSA